MSESLSPEEKDRLASLRPSELPPGESLKAPATWPWVMAGFIVLLAFVSGAIAGYFGGRIVERQRQSEHQYEDIYWYLGANIIGDDNGAILDAVYPIGPSGLAGLRDGDRIAAIDDQAVEDQDDARRIILEYDPGESILVLVERDHRYQQFSVTLGLILAYPEATTITPAANLAQNEARLGIYYRMVKPDDPFTAENGAMLISFLGDGTPAEASGLRPGDIITQVNHISLTLDYTLSEALVESGAGQTINLTVDRSGEVFTVQLVLH
nr:PDZ domain-containing protein [Anaerolineae bacterium]